MERSCQLKKENRFLSHLEITEISMFYNQNM